MNYQFKGVTLLITHYNRSNSLERLLKAFSLLKCEFEDIVVSDDGSKAEHLNHVENLKSIYSFRLLTAEKNRGLGNNINKGQDAVQTPFTLYVQEDFVPTEKFPSRLVESLLFMEERQDLDMVRFYAYFKYPYLRQVRDGFSEMKFSPLLWYWGYRKFYYYSDHPHLRRSDFFQKFGRYYEGINPDRTEYRMMFSFLQNKGKAFFYEDFQSLFHQQNSLSEPSTIKRNKWRESNSFFVSLSRHLYRYIRFNLDYHFVPSTNTASTDSE